MLAGAGTWEPLVNWLFLMATGAVAWHAIRFRDENGDPDFVRLLFGCIAAIWFADKVKSPGGPGAGAH